MKKDKFWRIVCECLCHFHGFHINDAQSLVRQFSEANGNSIFIYEQEPFWVACGMCGADIDIRPCLVQLLRIYENAGL